MTKTMKDRTGRRTATLGAIGVGLLLAGVVGGGALTALTRPGVEAAPLVPVPISRLAASGGPVTIHAHVSDVFGHDAIVTDDTGHALVDFGPRGDGLVAVGATPLIQGRFDDGILHATFLQDANGRLVALVPPPPPPPGPPPGPRDVPPSPSR